jgi:heme oxygenase (biliverdin-IX-beta and delta-forming)
MVSQGGASAPPETRRYNNEWMTDAVHDEEPVAEPGESAPTMLELLRTATAATHRQLEERLPLDNGWSRWRYAAFLRATLAVVAVVEPRIRRLLPDPPAGGTPGADRLRHDLALLHTDADVAPAPGFPEIETAAAAFGAAYVLQGSLLGGAVIARRLELDPDIPAGSLTYLRPSQAAGPAWREFVGRLNAFGADAAAGERHAAVVSARQTFASFEAAFSREGVL